MANRFFVKLLKRVLGVVVVVIAAGLVAIWFFDESKPSGVEGADADALARKMLTAINHEAWVKTGAVQWTFRGKNHHIWDRTQHIARVKWNDNEVFINLSDRTGMARTNGQKAQGETLEKLLDSAWRRWANDSFWLNPVSKIFDSGTRRSIVNLQNDEQALLVEFTSGGVTPGDAYLWRIDENGLPKSWKMWVSILPIGGLEATWENWLTLDTGVKVASSHKILFLELELTNIRAAETVEALEIDGEFFAHAKN